MGWNMAVKSLSYGRLELGPSVNMPVFSLQPPCKAWSISILEEESETWKNRSKISYLEYLGVRVFQIQDI